MRYDTQPTTRSLNIYPMHRMRFGFRWLAILALMAQLTGCQSLHLPNFGFPSDFDDNRQPTIESLEGHSFRINPDTDLVGLPAVMISKRGDTLPDIARHFGLGFNDITRANPLLGAWVPGADRRVVLPVQFILPDTPRKGIVLNLANMRLFHYPKAPKTAQRSVITYPIGIGRQGWSTPTGRTRITQKKANPSWTVPASILREHRLDGDPLPRVVKAGPNNPLGLFALRLSMPSYLIHGTNKPYGVGMRISHGCVRLYPENIETLFKQVRVGTQVKIVNQPYLIGWWHNMLYLEAHKPLTDKRKSHSKLKQSVLKQLKEQAKKTTTAVDWKKVENTLELANGIPTPILSYSRSLDRLTEHWDIVAHPDKFYGKPAVPPVTSRDWTALAGNFVDEVKAQRLAEILTHQGPPLPARVIETTKQYQVIVGPYKNRREANSAKKRLYREFEIDAKIIQPLI